MDRELSWEAAKLMDMEPREGEDPVDFIDRFRMHMRDEKVQDSEIYGNILLRILDAHYGDFGHRLRQVNAGQPSDTRPELNAFFIADVSPIIYVEQ
ncbi:unnamed protein product [Absidia cylindrospora]